MKKLKICVGIALCVAATTLGINNVNIYADNGIDQVKDYVDYEDPEYWKYYGNINNSNYSETGLQLYSEPSAYDDKIVSPFTGKEITHDETFKNCQIINGIDVSKYQKDIDWSKAMDAGVDFAIIRAGYRSLSSGSLNEDPYFKKNMKNSQAAGLEHVGVYMFSQAITTKEAVEEAEYVLDLVKGYKFDLPIVMDVEYAYGSNGIGRLNGSISKSQLTEIVEAFCERIKKAGYTPMLYTNPNFFNNKLDGPKLSSEYDLWLAHYTTNSSYTKYCKFWQYSSDGKIDGIEGRVDCNVWYNNSIPSTALKLSASNVTLTSQKSVQLKATMTPSNSTDKVKYTSSNPGIAYVNSKGVVVGVSKGQAQITVKTTSGLTKVCNVTVNENLADYKIYGLTNAVYTGKSIVKDVTVKSKNKIAKKGVVTADTLNVRKGPTTNYGIVDVMYKDAAFTITGTTVIDGSIWYAVTYEDTENGNDITGYVAGGKSGTEYEKVTSAYVTLKEDVDYQLTFENNKNMGAAKVIVKGCGKGTYGGKITSSFDITPAKVKKVEFGTSTLSSNTIKWASVDKASGYIIYRASAKDGKYVKVGQVSKYKNQFTDKGLDDATAYFYKIKSFKKIDNVLYKSEPTGLKMKVTKKASSITGTTKKAVNIVTEVGGTKKVRKINANKKITVRYIIHDKNNVKWYSVTYKGKTAEYKGYVKASYIDMTKTGKVTATSLNVRKGAGTTYLIVGNLKKSSKVTIVSSKNDWYKIKFTSNGKSKTGYVKKEYIKII